MMGRGIVQKKGIQSLVRDEIVHIHAIYQDKVRVNENQIQFVYHQGELLYEKGGEESSYHLGGGIEAVWQSEKNHYYHQDEQLSTAFITNEKREIQNHYQYDAFGNGICQEEGISNRIRYTGQQYDGVTGQYYLRARYYNPIVGRFLQEDVYQGDGLNLYAYCGNNPVRYYDPSGYSKTPEVYNTGCPGATTNGDVGNEESKVYESSTHITMNIRKNKPLNSPDIDKWYKKGGKISIDENGVWIYHDWEGHKVSYHNGYPDFKDAGLVRQEASIGPFADRNKDFKKAKEMGYEKNADGTWHHHEDGITLQEVETILHDRFRHRGGISKLKKK